MHRLMKGAIFVHVLEAMYALKLCADARVPPKVAVWWWFLTLVLGIGAIRPLKQQLLAAPAPASRVRAVKRQQAKAA